MLGLLGVYRELDCAVDAIVALKREKAGEITVYSPTARHELEHAIHAGPSVVRRYTLIGGLLGVTFGYWIAIWVSRYWPLVVGGKPVSSWVPYTIIGFEVMVLFGALSTVAGLFINARIPRFSDGDYGVWVECPPEKQETVRALLTKTGATEVRGER
jgi:hypothetical protein